MHIQTWHYRIFSFIAIIFFVLTVKGQGIQYDRILPLQPAEQFINDFEGVRWSSVVFGDVDGDGNQDVIISGEGATNDFICKLYKNDGQGNLLASTNNQFEGVKDASIAFGDIDGDGDLDLLITGQNDSYDCITKLYSNDGQGNFSEIINTPFEDVGLGSIAFSDIDGDGDLDVLITGQNNLFNPVTKLYTNDGNGVFTEVINTPFINFKNSSVAFSDIDSDGDEDLLIIGRDSVNNRLTKLYINDGNGVFTEDTGASFENVGSGSITFGDIDNDGHEDVLITGRNTFGGRVAKLYSNDGNGSFSEVTGTPFYGVDYSSAAFEDVDGDGDLDILILGKDASNSSITRLYTNDGLGNFSEVPGTTFVDLGYGALAFSDLNSNGFPDAIVSGRLSSNVDVVKIYGNDGTGNFLEASGSPLEGARSGSSAFADIDGDGNLDILITGRNEFNNRFTNLYSNDGNGNYTEVIGTPFDGVMNSSICFADIDGDGDQDVLITGMNNSLDRIAKLYSNDGSGNFSELTGTPFDGVTYSAVDFADIDGDGDQDLLITGRIVNNIRIAKLYANDGNGNFTELTGTPFDGMTNSTVSFIDIDNDGDQDVFITGRNEINEFLATLYINDGNGNFTELQSTPFEGVELGSVDFADVNNNGNLDIMLTGENLSGQNISRLYINNGSLSFSEIPLGAISGVKFSSIAFTDIDSDGDQDILITGQKNSGDKIAKLYMNNGLGDFTEVNNTPFEGVNLGTVAIADIDNDGDEDILITGVSVKNSPVSRLYRNNSCPTDNITSNITTCGSYTWSVNGNNYTQSGVYTSSYTNQSGCDSIHTLNLTIDCSLYANVSITNNVGANCDGIADANAFGGIPPYSYTYSNGDITPLVQDLCSGVYDLVVSDSDTSSYNTTFVVSDETIDYSNDPDYLDYLDSLFTSAVSNCDFDYTQPADSFYLDQSNINQLDSNIYELTWYVYQNMDTFIFTNVYYITDDLNGSFAFALSIYCEDVNRSVLASANFIYKTKGPLSVKNSEIEIIKLYPNPSSGFFTLKSSSIGKKYTIIDAQGRVIKSDTIIGETTHVNLEKEKAGIYYLRIDKDVLKMIKH